ncbi:MAG: T9SS type A sorting domain-containing protein [Lewinellaceae bacterium]|nr:T9SS type A sorting domain-containing protein [Lewinellaceae bacterium]
MRKGGLWPVAQLQPGVYLLKIRGDSGMWVQRFVKQ